MLHGGGGKVEKEGRREGGKKRDKKFPSFPPPTNQRKQNTDEPSKSHEPHTTVFHPTMQYFPLKCSLRKQGFRFLKEN